MRNHRGHLCGLDVQAIRELHKLVVYHPHDLLPEKYRSVKHHRSRTAGVIHIIPANDYLGIVRTLLTPAEVADYLSFREALIEKWEMEIATVPEPALVGQYLRGDPDARPSTDFIEYLRQLDHRLDEWDMSEIIATFPETSTTNSREPTEYYPIVRELALLKRNELREVKKRFQRSLAKARANEFTVPYRIAFSRTDCGFVFVPVTKEMLPHRRDGLHQFTLAHKYDLKLSQCVGISIADDADGRYTVDWAYVEFPWEHDMQLERLLLDDNPFREVKQSELPRYTFGNEK